MEIQQIFSNFNKINKVNKQEPLKPILAKLFEIKKKKNIELSISKIEKEKRTYSPSNYLYIYAGPLVNDYGADYSMDYADYGQQGNKYELSVNLDFLN